MKPVNLQTLWGPNLYSSEPVLRIRVAFEPCGGKLLSLHEGEATTPDSRHGDFTRGAILAKTLSAFAGSADLAGAHEIRLVDDEPGVQSIIVPAHCEEAMRFAIETCLAFLEAVENGREYPIEEKAQAARRLHEQTILGPSTQAIVDAAKRRGIPHRTVDAGSSLVRLGWGIHGRTVQATISSQTSGVAMDIASNKDLTKRLLAEAGLPVPAGRMATSAEEAVQALRDLGAPVVVKPLDGNQGRGVCLNLSTEEEVREAFAIAQSHSKQVIVEQLFTGRDYRVLVVNGRLVAASEKSPAQVVGDGRHSIRELIEELNRDPRRGDHHSKPLSVVKVDSVMEAFLRRNGRDLDTVPPSGECVALRDSANLSTGGQAQDVTDQVHPEMRLMFERASRVIGLDICGLDVVLPDISRKFEGFGGIIEVNAAPGLRMHQSPSEGQARDVGAAIIDMLFPNGSKGRIPVVAVSGNREMSTPLLGEILAFSGKCVGEAGSAGIAIGKQHIAAGDPSMSSAARIVLNDPMVEAAVLEISRDAIVESGLPFDWCDVAVFSNPEPDESDFRELGPEKLLTERVREGGTLVFHANDPRLPALREQLVDSRRLVLCSLDSNDTEIQNHLAAGGSACVLHGDWVELRHAESARRVVRASAIRGALGAATSSGLAGALAAVAASHALGLTPETVAAALVAMPATRPAYVQGINVMPLEERSKIFATMREQLRVPA